MERQQAAGAIAALEDFEAVFREHFAAVHRFIARRVGTARAEDLAAEVFATAYRRRAAYQPDRGSLRSWLYGIAANVVRGHWRDEQQLLELDARVARDSLGLLPAAPFAETTSALPRTIPYPMIDALTCPTTRTCYAAGSDLIAQRIGNTYNAGSSVVAITHDAGRTWQRVTFAVPAKVPGGMQGDSFMDIGQIQCPQPDACVAIGVSDQGSTSTPVYTNHGS